MTTEISIIGIFALLLIGCSLGFIVGWEVANRVWERTISDMLSPGMIISTRVEESIFEYHIFHELCTVCGREIMRNLKTALVNIIPDIECKFLDGDIGKLFFESDGFSLEVEDADDIEKNYKTLSQIIVDIFPQLNGIVFDDCIFLNRDQQEEVKGCLRKLKKG